MEDHAEMEVAVLVAAVVVRVLVEARLLELVQVLDVTVVLVIVAEVAELVAGVVVA